MSVCSDHYWTIAALDDRAPLFLRCCPRGWATIMYVCLYVAREKFLRPITAQKKRSFLKTQQHSGSMLHILCNACAATMHRTIAGIQQQQ